MNLVQYWKAFENTFKEQLTNVTSDQYREAWKSSSNRTALYERVILPSVAQNLGLVFKSEEWKIDFTLCRDVNGYPVPEIFIESENVALSAHHEIRKLCCLSSPLKILIVCAEWSDREGDWPHGGLKYRLLEQWASIIKNHSKVWLNEGVTGIIVAEANATLSFYSIAFDHFGEVVSDHSIIFERDIFAS
ncbi:hypothetical protein KO528_15380 [Saccharophagus degradans]|uniref:hypothetical protein n=1 Tax=Saccharophagus degradans TaxID=86304 RepID=UPI001C09BD32|nr:hypothetical protein [Saccharophagus degradans]MBU2986746.1 hypothetical protein [Saccharophagus degradans]